MKKSGLKRIIFLSIALLLCAICAVIGIIKYNDGYGENGDIRKDLKPIVKLFNKNKNIRNSYLYPKAEIIDNKLSISYMKNNNKRNINFFYYKNNDLKYLTITYNDLNKSEAEFLSKELMEVVSSNNGNEYGSLFKNYSFNYLYLTNMKDDNIELYNEGNLTTLSFTIDKNISTILDKKLNKEDLSKNITILDIKDMIDEIKINNKFELKKDKIHLYVNEVDKYYNIYFFNEENSITNNYNSIMSVIKVLNVKTYDRIKNSVEKFTIDRDNIYYKVEMNPTLSNELKSINKKFIKISIKK